MRSTTRPTTVTRPPTVTSSRTQTAGCGTECCTHNRLRYQSSSLRSFSPNVSPRWDLHDSQIRYVDSFRAQRMVVGDSDLGWAGRRRRRAGAGSVGRFAASAEHCRSHIANHVSPRPRRKISGWGTGFDRELACNQHPSHHSDRADDRIGWRRRSVEGGKPRGRFREEGGAGAIRRRTSKRCHFSGRGACA